jgi:TRAP-type C4-dicarboxylate transport system permease small subunit
MSSPGKIKRRLDRVSEDLLRIAGLTCLALPVIILVVVVVRAIVPAGIPLWSIDICELLMWFVTYLGLGLVWRMGRHVTVDVFVKQLNPKWRKLSDKAILLVLLTMTLIMMAGGLRVCWGSWAALRKTANEFPEYYFSLAIPVGLLFLVYEVVVSLRKHFSGIPPAPAGH